MNITELTVHELLEKYSSATNLKNDIAELESELG